MSGVNVKASELASELGLSTGEVLTLADRAIEARVKSSGLESARGWSVYQQRNETWIKGVLADRVREVHRIGKP